MKPTVRDIEKFVNNPVSTVRAILLYGSNFGLIEQRYKLLINNFLGKNRSQFSLISIDFDKIKDNLALLQEELNALSFMTPKKIIKINGTFNNVSEELYKILSHIRDNIMVIIIAEELGPNSKLRKFFEQADNVISIACYEDTELDIKNHILNKLLQDNYQISQEALNSLIEKSPLNRLIIDNELEKIKLYLLNDNNMNAEDIELCVNDSNKSSIENFCQKFILKEKQSLKIYDYLLKEDIDLIAISRNLTRYINKLLEIFKNIELGLNINEAIKKIQPVIFFKQIPIFIKSIDMWNEKQLIDIIYKINEFEIIAKKSENIKRIVFENFILNIVNDIR